MDLSDDLAQLYPAFLVTGDVLVPEEWAVWKAAEDHCAAEKEYLKRRASMLVQDMDLAWKLGRPAGPGTKPELSAAAAHEAKVVALRSFGVVLAAEAFRHKILRTPDRSELEC